MDLDLWGTPVRVRVDVPEAATALRTALSHHLLPEPAPLGFVVERPSSPNGLTCLIDRSGLVLARARTWQEVVGVLAEHLTTFAPPPPDTVRTTMRAVVRRVRSAESAVLAGFPLLNLPPLVERQLERRGQRVVDRLALDMTSEGQLALRSLPWPELRPHELVGHCGADASGVPVDSILIPQPIDAHPTRRQSVAFIASGLMGSAPDAALDLAEKLAGRTHGVLVRDARARSTALEG